jgi:translation initiation factor IF-3
LLGLFVVTETVRGDFSIVRPPLARDRQDGFRKDKTDGPRINGAIVAKQIRVIDENGEMRGVMPVREALTLAEEAGLDLIEISPNADPPVCKILDAGKYKYEMQKKAAEARKKQKVIELKEIKLRPMIDDHDFNIKMKNAKSFLEDGDKVKITLRFRGREMSHQDIAQTLLKRVREELDEHGKVDSEPSFEGRQIVMVLSAKS